MAYKGKRARPRLTVEQMMLITLACSFFALGFALCNLFWTVASAKEPEPMPESVAVVEQDDGRLPGDDIPAAEYAVLQEPVPEIVSLGAFTLTHYCPCELCCGEWADGLTYTETVATEGRTIAVDPDVIPLGSTVEIDGQQYIAEDIGAAIQGNRIDIFMNSHEAALVEGIKTAEVFIYE